MNRQKTSLFIFVLCLIVFAACFRLYGLTFQSMWLDELLSLNHTVPSDGISVPIHYARTRDGSPPLFNVLLWAWRLVFGTAELPARALSAIFGILGVLSMFFLGRELFSAKTGIYASIFTAVLPFHIYYSQEVRPYSLLFLLCALSYFFFVKFLKQKKLKWGLLYVLATSFMLYTNYFGFLVLFAQMLYLGVIFLRDWDADKKSLIKSFILLGILIVLTYLPWIARLNRMIRIKKSWADIPPSDYFMSYFRGYLGGELYVVFVCLFLMGVYILHKSSKDEFPHHKVLFCSWILCVIALPYFRSLYHAVLLTPRNTIAALPAIVLMVSVGLNRIKRSSVQILVFGSITLLLFINIFYTDGNYYTTVTKEQWREAARHVLVKDPEEKYPVFVDGRIRYYFKDVYKSERVLRPRILTLPNSERAHKFISEKKIHGFWVIEAHQRMDKEAQQFLDARYSVKERKPLRGARVTFYVLREPQK